MIKFKFSNILLYIFCLEILCFSGGLRFIENARACQLVWLSTCVLMYFMQPKFLKRNFESNLLIVFLAIWSFVSTVFINVKADYFFLRFISYPLGMIFAISFLRFNKFRKSFLYTANVLMSVSIIIHLLYNFDIIQASQVIINDYTRNLCYYFFNVKWDNIYLGVFPLTRFCSIYWEPGMCQIVIMFILVLHADDISKNLLNVSFIFRKYGILIAALILTGSTMGYIVMGVYFAGLFVLQNKRKITHYPFYIILGGALFYSVFTTDIVQDKLSQRNDVSDNTSYAIRLSDNIACLNVALENPIFGLGVNSKELQRHLTSEGNVTASNGWLYSAAEMGFVYLLVLLYAIYVNLKRMNFGISPLFLLSVLFISQSNESSTYFPYMWIYACTFLNYKTQRYKALT